MDYTLGKQVWAAYGRTIEGRLAARPRAGDVARRDVPTCRIHDRVGTARERAGAMGVEVCVVVNESEVVLGLLRSKELAEDERREVREVMRPGPSTFRPHVDIAEMAGHMKEHDSPSAPVTTPDGRLVGVLFREDAERAVREAGDDE